MCDSRVKCIAFLSFVVAIISVLYVVDDTHYAGTLGSLTFRKNIVDVFNKIRLVFSAKSQNSFQHRIFTRDELKLYDGQKHSKGLLLSIIGQVYDVENGRRHYGPEGGYSIFAGRDATRAYVTGDFKPDGLTDDITDLKLQDYLGIDEWRQFYEKTYKFVGVLCGTFYDCGTGLPTPALVAYKDKLVLAEAAKDVEKSELELFPSCNSRWQQGAGGYIWCEDKSGGIERGWAGVPRLFHVKTKGHMRCACVRNFGPPSSDPDSTDHDNVGDLKDPRIREYDHCAPDSTSCPIPES